MQADLFLSTQRKIMSFINDQLTASHQSHLRYIPLLSEMFGHANKVFGHLRPSFKHEYVTALDITCLSIYTFRLHYCHF